MFNIVTVTLRPGLPLTSPGSNATSTRPPVAASAARRRWRRWKCRAARRLPPGPTVDPPSDPLTPSHTAPLAGGLRADRRPARRRSVRPRRQPAAAARGCRPPQRARQADRRAPDGRATARSTAACCCSVAAPASSCSRRRSSPRSRSSPPSARRAAWLSRLAESFNMTLAGFVGEDGFNIYTGAERIVRSSSSSEREHFPSNENVFDGLARHVEQECRFGRTRSLGESIGNGT